MDRHSQSRRSEPRKQQTVRRVNTTKPLHGRCSMATSIAHLWNLRSATSTAIRHVARGGHRAAVVVRANEAAKPHLCVAPDDSRKEFAPAVVPAVAAHPIVGSSIGTARAWIEHVVSPILTIVVEEGPRAVPAFHPTLPRDVGELHVAATTKRHGAARSIAAVFLEVAATCTRQGAVA